MANIELNYNPRPWQQKVHKSLKRFSVLALHRRAGKTELALMHLIKSAMKFERDLPLFVYVAPFLKQAKLIAWARLKQRLRPLELVVGCEFNEGELFVRFSHNNAIIRVLGADNPDALRGVRLDGAVIDEVAQIKPEVWTDIIQPALSDRKGFCMFIGTPQGVNLFSELYYKGFNFTDWYCDLFSVYDTDALDPTEVERLRRDMSETSFAREYLCDFTASGADQLMSLADINDACRRTYTARDIAYAPRILGVDPARFGDDRSVIFPRQGLVAFPPIVMRGVDNMTLAAKVCAKAEEWQADAIFVDAGAGSGVIDRCRQLGFDVMEVNFGGKPNDDRYKNKRSEIWYNLAEWLRAGGSLPNDTNLKQDLGAPTFDYDRVTNKIILESKDDIKSRGLPSPDLGDGLALTFSNPVVKKSPISFAYEIDVVDDGMRNNNGAGYNPYENLG